MRKLQLLSLAAIAVWIFVSCSGGYIKRDPIGGVGEGKNTTIVVGRIIIDPQPEEGQRGFYNNEYDGQVRIFLDNILKMPGSHEEEYWRNWPVYIEGAEGDDFYYRLSNSRYYSVMAGYMLARNGSYELIKLPLVFTLDIQPGDRAIYIGTIKFTRDPFYHIKRIDVYDEYARVLPYFIERCGNGIKLKKALAKVLNKVKEEE